MKKTIYLVFILFSSFLHAQKFEFDLLTKYLTKMELYNFEKIIYSNSKDQNYFLLINGNSALKRATLCDLKKMISHNFEVLESKSRGEVFFEFKYVDSKMINYNKIFYEYEFEYTTIDNDSLNKTIKVDVYKNSKRKKSKMSLILQLKKSTDNLFPLFRFSCLHPFELIQKLNVLGNFIIESAKGTTLFGKKIEHKLLNYKKVKFELDIPINIKPKG